MIEAIGSVISGAFDLALGPLRALGAWPSLAAVSAVTGLALVLAFRSLSDQRRIGVARDRMAADLMALSLYRATPGVIPRILAGLARRALARLRLQLRPLAVLALPLLVLLFQLEGRYAHRPLKVGETALVSAIVKDPGGLESAGIALYGGPGVSVETPPVRIGAQRRAVWRVRATGTGAHEVRVAYGGAEFSKRIVVGSASGVLSETRTSVGRLARLLRAGEGPVDASSGIESISVAYPPLALGGILGLRLSWLAWFLLVSAAAALALKGFLRVAF